VGPRVGLDVVAKRIFLVHYRKSNPGRPVRSLVTIPTELPLSLERRANAGEFT
jgi:hypothetical protein